MSGSGLAAVHQAAASLTTSMQPPPAAPLAPATTNAAASATTLADLQAGFPDLCAAIRAEGAAAERERIIGIEAHAMPGHESLIASMKADGSITPDMAAGRILAAERGNRGAHMAAIQGVETLTGVVNAAPTSADNGSEKATTPDGWKAEYAVSEKLQAEFASAEDYVALRKAEASGKVRVLNNRASA